VTKTYLIGIARRGKRQWWRPWKHQDLALDWCHCPKCGGKAKGCELIVVQGKTEVQVQPCGHRVDHVIWVQQGFEDLLASEIAHFEAEETP
jgi:hypothetical protein